MNFPSTLEKWETYARHLRSITNIDPFTEIQLMQAEEIIQKLRESGNNLSILTELFGFENPKEIRVS